MSEDLFKKALERGVVEVYPTKEAFQEALKADPSKLHFYLGIDPTAPFLHLGHAIPARKLEQLRELGCKVTLLIGSFTATIGDPTDKTATRKALTQEEVEANAKDYLAQLKPILDIDNPENPVEVRRNGEWLAGMTLADFAKLAQHITAQRLLERDMFQVRIREGKPIYLHELVYPLLQGYDSVAMQANGEVGGNDQTFNMLVGRDLQKALNNVEKFVVTTKLLEDPSGKKMGKSEGNAVPLNAAPAEMFGQIMSWPDGVVKTAFEVLTDEDQDEVAEWSESLGPRDFKAKLAHSITAIFHGVDAAVTAEQEFDRIFKSGGVPSDIVSVEIADKVLAADELLVKLNLADSKSDARRVIEEGGMSIDEQTVTDPKAEIEIKKDAVVRRGKRRFARIA